MKKTFSVFSPSYVMRKISSVWMVGCLLLFMGGCSSNPFVQTRGTNQIVLELETPEGQYAFGNQCFEKEDYEQAVFWYRKAADQRHQDAVRALRSFGIN